jgi:FAD:protein FMN transferase
MSDVFRKFPLYLQRVRRVSIPVTALVSALVCAAGAACSGPRAPVTELRGSTMGTTYSVRIVHFPQSIARAGLETEIADTLQRIDARMTTYRNDSELMRFNAMRSTDWTDASPELVAVLQEARRVSELTGGAFDVTVGPVVNLWGFGPEMHADAVPDDAAIAAALARVGYDRVETRAEPPAVRKTRPDVYVDLSGIAKGYAADRVAALLDARGCTDYVVAVGGELHARGRDADGTPWRVGIERPDGGRTRPVQRVVRATQAGVSTSGDYRTFFEADEQHFSHIVDPKTGRPVTHGLASVTIIADTTIEADALSTALMVLGPEAGYELALRAGIAALLIRRSGDGFVETATPAFARYVE